MFTNEDISRYYDLSETHYRRVWRLDKNKSLHYGYWDDHTKSFRHALLRINQILADMVDIKPGEKILDAGCGVGGSSVWLAKERDAYVTGISINAGQIGKAEEFAATSGLQDKTAFKQCDYNNTGFDSRSFDIVWAIESICYADDKLRFLREAYRLLRPGGRIIIADFFIKKGLVGKDASSVKQFANCWAINSFATQQEFEEDLKLAGFVNIEWVNITGNILPSAKRLYRSWLLGSIAAKIYGLINRKATSLGKNNVDNARLQYTTLKKGLWEYLIVKADRI